MIYCPAYFDAVCRDPGANLVDTQTQLLLGITRTRAYDLLDEAFDGGLHPLDLFEFEMQLKSADSDFCSLTSEQA